MRESVPSISISRRKFFHSYMPRDIAAYIPNRGEKEREGEARSFSTTITILIFFTPPARFPVILYRFSVSTGRIHTHIYADGDKHAHPTRSTSSTFPLTRLTVSIQSTFFKFLFFFRTRTSRYKQESLINDMTMTVI